MARSRLLPALLLLACGGSSEPALEDFAGHTLSVSAFHPLNDAGTEKLDDYEVWVELQRPLDGATPRGPCLALRGALSATLDGVEMESFSDSSGPGPDGAGCINPSFALRLPRSRFETPGNARVVLKDASHTMEAEFHQFYGARPEGSAFFTVTVRCEGVARCLGGSS